MKTRHAVVLALVGWYLMVPPYIGSTGLADKEQLSAWQRFGPYKSESDCADSKRKWEGTLEAPHSATDTRPEQGLMASQEALCVPDNDPRLNGN
jgi:hypothetical protein